MKTPAKLGLGCATLTPLVSALVLGCYIGYELIAWDLEHRGLAAPPDPVGGLIDGPFAAEHWIAFGVVAVSIALLELALTVVLTVHAARDPRLPGWAIAVWLAGFLLAGPLATLGCIVAGVALLFLTIGIFSDVNSMHWRAVPEMALLILTLAGTAAALFALAILLVRWVARGAEGKATIASTTGSSHPV